MGQFLGGADFGQPEPYRLSETDVLQHPIYYIMPQALCQEKKAGKMRAGATFFGKALAIRPLVCYNKERIQSEKKESKP